MLGENASFELDGIILRQPLELCQAQLGVTHLVWNYNPDGQDWQTRSLQITPLADVLRSFWPVFPNVKDVRVSQSSTILRGLVESMPTGVHSIHFQIRDQNSLELSSLVLVLARFAAMFCSIAYCSTHGGQIDHLADIEACFKAFARFDRIARASSLYQ